MFLLKRNVNFFSSITYRAKKFSYLVERHLSLKLLFRDILRHTAEEAASTISAPGHCALELSNFDEFSFKTV